MNILATILSVVIGYVAHQTAPIFAALRENETPSAWVRLSEYVTGGLCVTAVSGAIAPKRFRRLVVLHVLAAHALVGVGVVFGYWRDFAATKKPAC